MQTALKLSEHLPPYSQGLKIFQETLRRSGANTETGLNLHHVFEAAGLPTPSMELSTILGSSSDLTRWLSDILSSLRPQIQRLGISSAAVGDFDTLEQRLQEEVKARNAVMPGVAFVGAWCTK